MEHGDDHDGLGICEVEDCVGKPPHEGAPHLAIDPLELVPDATHHLDRRLNPGHKLRPETVGALLRSAEAAPTGLRCRSQLGSPRRDDAAPYAASRSAVRARARRRSGPRETVRTGCGGPWPSGRRMVQRGDRSRGWRRSADPLGIDAAIRERGIAITPFTLHEALDRCDVGARRPRDRPSASAFLRELGARPR